MFQLNLEINHPIGADLLFDKFQTEFSFKTDKQLSPKPPAKQTH